MRRYVHRPVKESSVCIYCNFPIQRLRYEASWRRGKFSNYKSLQCRGYGFRHAHKPGEIVVHSE